ncbi:MAG: hypothetical protein LBK73_07395 [Treponema sp.]|jgi:hypothetical protein|nr:hypothetical protein [Treponema sp.]
MVKTWNTVFATQGSAWGIPPAHIPQLASDAHAAETILGKVKGGERTASHTGGLRDPVFVLA